MPSLIANELNYTTTIIKIKKCARQQTRARAQSRRSSSRVTATDGIGGSDENNKKRDKSKSKKKCSCNKNKPSKMFVTTTTTTTVLLPSHLAEQASDSRFSTELMPSAAYVYGEPSSSLH